MTETEEQPQQAEQQTVTMFSPEGRLADVPAENSDKATAAGFRKAVTMTSPEGRRAYVPPDKAQEALKQNFAVGLPEQQPRVKMYDQDKNYKEIPANAQDYALQNGWRKGMEFTSPSGAGLTLHPDQAQDALNLGWRTGVPSQQPQPGFVVKTIGGMSGIDSSDIANHHFSNSSRGKQVLEPPQPDLSRPRTADRLYQSPAVGSDTSTDKGIREAGGINELAFQKLTKPEQSIIMNEARVRAGMPWESKVAEAMPIAGSMVASGATAVKSAKEGRYSEAGGHGLAAITPFFGAPAEASGEAFGQGHVKEGLQNAALALGPTAIEPVAKGIGAVREAIRPTPRSPLSQIIRPKDAVAFHEAEQTAAPLVRTAAAERGQPVKTVDDALDNIREAKQSALIDAQNTLQQGQTVADLAPSDAQVLKEKTDALTTLEQHLTDAKKAAEEAKEQPTRAEAAGRVVRGAAKMGAGVAASKILPGGHIGLELAGVGWGMRDIAGGIKDLVARRALTTENLNKVVSESFSGKGPVREPSPQETVSASNQPVDTSAPVHETTPGPPDQPGGDLKIKTEPVKPAPRPLPVRDPVTGRMKSAVQPPDNASTPKIEVGKPLKQDTYLYHGTSIDAAKEGLDPRISQGTIDALDDGEIQGKAEDYKGVHLATTPEDAALFGPRIFKVKIKKGTILQQDPVGNGPNGSFLLHKEPIDPSSISEILSPKTYDSHMGNLPKTPPSNASKPVEEQIPQTEFYPKFGSRADLLDDKMHQEAMRQDLERHDRSAMKDFMEANTFPTTTKSERIAGYRNGEDAAMFQIARAPEAELRKLAEARNLDVTDSDNSLTLAQKLHDSMTPEEVNGFNEALTNLAKKRENGYRNQALKEIAPGRRMSDLSDAELKKVEDRAKQLKSQRGSATDDEMNDQLKKAMAGSAKDTDYMTQAVKEVGGDRNFAQLNPTERTQAIARAQELKSVQRGSSTEDEISKIPFYSRGAQVADQKLPPVFSAEQARNTLKNAGISGDELKVANDWLADQTGKVKKADLVDAMNNGLKVNVVKKEVNEFDAQGFIEKHPDTKKLRALGYDIHVEVPEEGDPAELSFGKKGDQDLEDGIGDMAEDLPPKARKIAQKIEKDFIAARDAHGRGLGQELDHDQAAQLARELAEEDHGENIANSIARRDYGKHWSELTQEQQEKIMDSEEYSDELDTYADQYAEEEGAGPSSTKYSEYQVPGGTNYREHLLQIPEKANPKLQELRSKINADIPEKEQNRLRNEIAKISQSEPGQFQSTHFDEPNVVAHARMNDRVDVNGKKTLFLEELQSDWHQAGRDEGYLDPGKKYLSGEIERGNSNGVPDAPFKKDWPLLLLKHALREAVEKGQDQVAWAPGSVQAERYDLSRHVDEIRVEKTGVKDEFNIKGFKNGNTTPILQKSGVPAADLSDNIGKDLAKKALSLEVGKEQVYSGKDLQVGGQGMKGFYDEMLPAIANKYLKRWGAKVETTEIPSGEPKHYMIESPQPGDKDGFIVRTFEGETVKSGFSSSEEAQKFIDNQTIKVPVIKINPSMRHDILKGQPISELSMKRDTTNA